MAEELTEEEEVEYAGTMRINFIGYTLPHWRYEFVDGDRARIEDLVRRANAVIGLLPPSDPQFRRNRDRVQRDADREGITVEWVGVAADEDRSVDEKPGRERRPARDAQPSDAGAASS